MCFPEPLRSHNIGILCFLVGLMTPLLLLWHFLDPEHPEQADFRLRYVVLFGFLFILIGGTVSIVIGIWRYYRYYRHWVPSGASFLTPVDARGHVIQDESAHRTGPAGDLNEL